jgi:hypothetical protein
MARYSALRLLMFFGFLCALWLLGLRDFWLVVAAALGSMAVSFFVLRGPREEFSRRIAQRVDERTARAAQGPTDEDVEDDEDEGTRG